MRRFLRCAVAAIAATAVLSGCAGNSGSAGPQSLAGKPAPSFAVPALQGGTSSLSRYRGDIVVLNLWGTWCPPCREEMPDLQRLYRTFASRGVVVLGVDEGESAPRVSAFARSLEIHYPILLDGDQRYGRAYEALGMPTTIIVDRRGLVARGFDGPLVYSQMVSAIAPLLHKT